MDVDDSDDYVYLNKGAAVDESDLYATSTNSTTTTTTTTESSTQVSRDNDGDDIGVKVIINDNATLKTSDG